MLLVTLVIAFLVTLGLATLGANNPGNSLIQIGTLIVIYVLGRGAPDLTKMTARSWGGFWGWVTSPMMAAALIAAGFISQKTFYFGAAIAHIAGWITIRLIWRIFFLRK